MMSRNLWPPGQKAEILREFENSQYWETTVTLAGRAVKIDINIDHCPLESDRLDLVEETIIRLDHLDVVSRDGIRRDHDDPSIEFGVRMYRTHRLSELDSNELKQCFGQSDPSRISVDDFLGALKLVRVGFYPEKQDEFAVLDYTIGRSVTDYLIVVKHNVERTISSITVES